MVVTVALVNAFEHLNGDRSLARIQNPASREREAIVDITFSNTDTYVTGGLLVPFHTIRKFSQVYFCQFMNPTHNGIFPEFVAGANNDADKGKIKFSTVGNANSPLAQLGNSATNHRGTIRALIRGI